MNITTEWLESVGCRFWHYDFVVFATDATSLMVAERHDGERWEWLPTVAFGLTKPRFRVKAKSIP